MSDSETLTNRAKMTVTNDSGLMGPLPTCKHWVHRKKRYCKMTVAKGREYCGEHEPAISANIAQDTNSDRIPCPLDGKHTIYKNKLDKHLRICNARQRDDLPDYIKKDINAGPLLCNVDELVAHNTLKLHELCDDEFYNAVNTVKQLYAKYVENTIETLDCRHKSLNDELAKPDYGNETLKQLKQTSALLGVLEGAQQLCDDISYIEFGAGKGHLAFYLANVIQAEQLKNSQVILLDRMSLRHKRDNKIVDRTLVQRIRADIADFDMCELELLQRTKRNVALSKHLCGAATDLTLRCIVTAKEANKCTTKTDYIMIALCCHHRCDWRSYVGKEFLLREQLTPRQFVIITKMVSWAICGTGMSRKRRKALEETEQQQKEAETRVSTEDKINQRMTREEREKIGFMCKRLLDHGRLEYLRQHGYSAVLKNYVARDVTLENVCLLAHNN